LPAPCKGKKLLAAEFISGGSKDTLLCSVEHKNPPDDGLKESWSQFERHLWVRFVAWEQK
jgi:hypothetical protein